MRRARRTRAIVVSALLGLALVVSGCVPLENAPQGGGEIVTQTFRYGPFTLGPGEEARASPASGLPRPTGAFGLKGARFNVVDQNGTPVSVHDVHLHHLVLTTSAREDQLCPQRRERFLASGMERTPVSFGGPYAYLVGANDQWGAIYHLMNETAAGTPAKTIYIEYTLDYQPNANATNSRPLDVYFEDVAGCGGSTFDVPGGGGAGSVFEKSKSWVAPRDGIAVYAGGHLHEGGIDITLEDEDVGYTMCTGTATYHENPTHLSSINPCPLHHRVIAGNRYKVTARYDNSQPWNNVMGIVMTWVWWGTQ